jgi:dipeptidyl aminopeptidase/acylaminoacyl peptidase
MCLFAPVLAGIAHDKQRETASQRAKHGPSARRFTVQPVRHWDHWLHENPDLPCTHLIEYATGGRRIDLTPDARLEFAIEPELDLSEDGRRVAALSRRPGADRELDVVVLLIDLETRVARELGAADCVYYEGLVFSPDGKTVATTHSRRDPKVAVRPLLTLFDTASGAARTIGERWDRWPLLGAWSADGKRLIVTADDDGHKPVYSIAVDSGTVERLSARSAGGAHDHPTVLADGRIAVVRSSLLDAPECWIVAAKRESAPQPLARLSGFTDAGGWAEVESFTTPSTDGAPIQSFLVRPKGAKERLPLAFWIHGGPIGMDTDGWHWRWNPLLLVAQGYAVALPNPRGSTGFGQKFVDEITMDWAGRVMTDLDAVFNAVTKLPYVDATKQGVAGASYGGYAVDWIIGHDNRFKVAVSHDGVFNLESMALATEELWFTHWEFGGLPWGGTAKEQFAKFSPHRYSANIKTPTLVITNQLDFRVPVDQGLQLFTALRLRGVPSEALVFEDEGHWVLKTLNSKLWHEKVFAWMNTYLSK